MGAHTLPIIGLSPTLRSSTDQTFIGFKRYLFCSSLTREKKFFLIFLVQFHSLSDVETEVCGVSNHIFLDIPSLPAFRLVAYQIFGRSIMQLWVRSPRPRLGDCPFNLKRSSSNCCAFNKAWLGRSFGGCFF